MNNENLSTAANSIPASVAKLVIGTPVAFLAAKVARTLIESAKPEIPGRVANIAWNVGAWGLSSGAGALAAKEINDTIDQLDQSIRMMKDASNDNSSAPESDTK